MPLMISRKLGQSLTVLDDNDEPVATIEVSVPGKRGRATVRVVDAPGRFLRVVRSEVLGRGKEDDP